MAKDGESLTIRKFEGRSPHISGVAYVDELSILIGDVICEERSGVFPGAILRADESTIELGKGSFVLDLALIEAPSGRPVTIGEGTIISHGATLHGCSIGDSSVVGIGAVVLDFAQVGNRCIVAAGSLVPPGAKLDSDGVYMGTPVRKVRDINPKDTETIRREVLHLRNKIERYREEGYSSEYK